MHRCGASSHAPCSRAAVFYRPPPWRKTNKTPWKVKMAALTINLSCGIVSKCRILPFAGRLASKRNYGACEIVSAGQGSMAGSGQVCLEDRTPNSRSYSVAAPETTLAKYGGRYAVTMLPGHGIGPEMMNYVKEVYRYAGIPVDFEVINMDAERDDEDEVHLAITSIKRNGVAIKGNIETKVNRPNMKSRNVELRRQLDLYVNLLHCRSFPSIRTRHGNIDIVIVRQNTEGEYSMMENESVPGVVESLKIITTENSLKLARYAFEYAKKNNRKKVTCIHKANIMKISDGLFLECCKEVAKEYPDIEFNSMIIDNCCMQLVSNPQQFDVMITTNLYGAIVSNVVCGIVGGAGLLSGRNYGDRYAVFEPGTRNTGSAIAGKNIANPIAMLNASADLLEHLKLFHHAQLLRESIDKTIAVDKIHTPDLGGQATSIDVVQNIIKDLLSKTQTW